MALLFALLAAPMARAEVRIVLSATGGNVVATISGSANTAGLGTALHTTSFTVMVADPAFLIAGGGGSYEQQVNLNRYDLGLSGPSTFGTSDLWAPGDINSGDIAGFIYSPTNGSIYLPRNYVSQSALSGSTTWIGESFMSFGLTPGQSYTWTWGSGGDADSLTVQIVPEPSTLGLLTLGLLGFACAIRRRLGKMGGG